MIERVIHRFPEQLLKPGKCHFYLARRHLRASSPLSAYMGISGPIDERWMLKFNVDTYISDEWNALEALLNRMDGEAGLLTAFDPARLYPRGVATGPTPRTTGWSSPQPFSDGSYFSDGQGFVEASPTIQVAATAEAHTDLLLVSGLLPSQSRALCENDLLSICARGQDYGFLHAVLTDAQSNAAGQALLRVRPRLRMTAAAGDVVSIHRPRGVFKLSAEDDAQVERRYPLVGSFGCTLIEMPEEIIAR